MSRHTEPSHASKVEPERLTLPGKFLDACKVFSTGVSAYDNNGKYVIGFKAVDPECDAALREWMKERAGTSSDLLSIRRDGDTVCYSMPLAAYEKIVGQALPRVLP